MRHIEDEGWPCHHRSSEIRSARAAESLAASQAVQVEMQQSLPVPYNQLIVGRFQFAFGNMDSHTEYSSHKTYYLEMERLRTAESGIANDWNNDERPASVDGG